MAKLPPGLDRMSADRLVQECFQRGLDPTGPDPEKKPYLTCPQMILMIREEVSRCSTSPTLTRTRMDSEEDWTMEDQA